MRLFTAISLIMVLHGCSETPEPVFDGPRAFQHLEAQVAFGPRVPGSQAWADMRGWAIDHFLACGLKVDTQAFTFVDPYSGQTIPLVNVIAHYRPKGNGKKAALLGAHYDCRPRTDYHSDPARVNEPLAGANDGASGVAVLMELAALFKASPPEMPVDLVLFDGEDWGKEGDPDNYLLGSKQYATLPLREWYHACIVIDLIGDKDQQIPREGYSERFARPLNDAVFGAAKVLKIPTFIDSVRHSVLDDHLSIAGAGVPSIDLIDFDYVYWHTEKDTPDKCSAEALANVGKVLGHLVYRPNLWPNY